MHVAAGTHPKLVQTRMGHSNIGLTMDVYGKLAGDIALGKEQATRLDALAGQALLPAHAGSHLAHRSIRNKPDGQHQATNARGVST